MFRNRNRKSVPLLSLFLFLLVAAEAEALTHRVGLSGGGEGWLDPEQGGHGYFAASYDLGGLPRGSVLSLLFNTDTLRVSYGGLKLAGGAVRSVPTLAAS